MQFSASGSVGGGGTVYPGKMALLRLSCSLCKSDQTGAVAAILFWAQSNGL